MPAAVPRVSVITRSEWGAPAGTPSGLSALGRATRVTCHHTAQGYGYASKPDVSEADGKRAVKAVRASHLARRFSDTGYHLLIDGAGRVYQGRAYAGAGSFGPGRTPPRLALGSHVGGKNTGNIGVNLLGCFGGGPKEKGCDDTPSPAALAALADVLTALCAAYDVAPGKIVGHRDLAPNVCPGDRLYTKLPGLRHEVALRLAKS